MENDNAGKFERFVRGVSKTLVYICSGLLLFMLLLGISDVMGRYLFNKPIIGTLEIFEILVPAIVLLGLAYTQQVKAHVTVDLFCSRLSPRPRAILEIFTTCWAIVLFVIIGWQGISMAILYHEMNSYITNIRVPTFLPRLLVPIGAVAICLVLVVDLFSLVNAIRKKD